MAPIFLAFHHPAGETKFAPLDTANEPIFFLPSEVDDEIVLDTTWPPGRNDVAQIDVISSYPFLSAYGKEICRLLIDGVEISIPKSTEHLQRFVMLRDGDQFETSAGRWEIQRDDEQGTIQNSMRPPPLPEQPVEGNLEPMEVPEKTTSLQHTAQLPEHDSGPVDDIPYSDSPILDRPLQESDRHILNEALAAIPDLGPMSTIQTPTTPIDEVEDNAPGASLVKSSLQHIEESTATTSPSKRKRARSGSQERVTKKKKTKQGSVRFSSDESEQVQVENTIIVDTTPIADHREPAPSSVTKPQKGRSKKEETLASTPDPGDPVDDVITPSPVASSLESTRSRRSVSAIDSSFGELERAPVVYFASNTTIDKKAKIMKTFRKLGGKSTTKIGEANMLCVVDGELKKSEALLVAIAMGADIVTENWIIDTHRKGRFPDPSKYLPTDKKHEKEWDFRIEDAVQRGKAPGLSHLLANKTVFLTARFTTSLGKTCTQGIRNIATALGAEVTSLRRNGKKLQMNGIAIGVADDLEAAEVGRQGMRLYDKELLTNAVLNGELDLEGDDYSIYVPVKEEYED